jgi:hypothetical protein
MFKGIKSLFFNSNENSTMNGQTVESPQQEAFMSEEKFFNGVPPNAQREKQAPGPPNEPVPKVKVPEPTYVQQDAMERLDTFVSDRTRLHWNRGYRYGYSLDGNQDIFDALIDAHIGEFRSIVKELIRQKTDELDEARFMLDNGTPILQSRLKPMVERCQKDLENYQSELTYCLNKEGMIEHSIKQFETGWQRGVYQFSKDYMAKKVNKELIEETKKEVFA